MHFAKTYTQLLAELPPEFRNNVFEYRKLKQLVNQTASELESLGLSPSVLRSLHEQGETDRDLSHFEGQVQDGSKSNETVKSESPSNASHVITYEIVINSSAPETRLRLSSGYPSDVDAHHDTASSTTRPIYRLEFPVSEQLFGTITRGLPHPSNPIEVKNPLLDNSTESNYFSDLIISLPSDTAFFHLLTSTLSSLSGHMGTLQDGFNLALASLVASISLTARPTSSSAPHSFSAYSITADNSMSLRPRPGGISDLYTWREIFRLYAEAEPFESIKEPTLGERSIEKIEKQLDLFKGRTRDQRASLVLPGSREAFDAFFNLNLFILGVKKFQLANSEATRKILKKHVRRTMLPIPSYLLEPTSPHRVMSLVRSSKALPRLLVQAIGEVLLPIVPHVDDYACRICTAIAFKPIRLFCGHFFCVRCLAKMQKRRMPNCPMCRAPTVLQASPSNLDYGLLNFMIDWFPVESLEKLRANEREVTQEQLEAFGIADVHACRIM